MVRRLLMFFLSVPAFLLFGATPAWATCVVLPMEEVVEDAQAVWWVHITDATVARPVDWSGTWKLTVRLDDVLKGPGSQGSQATVITSTCGPAMTPEQQAHVAHSYLGRERLFMGAINKDGALDASSAVLTPQRLSYEQQYSMALSLLGQTPGVQDVDAPGEFPWTLLPWLLGFTVAVGAVIATVVATRRRRRNRAA